jgi:hypothetical protein
MEHLIASAIFFCLAYLAGRAYSRRDSRYDATIRYADNLIKLAELQDKRESHK